MFPIRNPQKAITSSFVKTGDLFWSYEISLFYWSREYYHYHDPENFCKFYLYMCVSKINFNPTIVLCSTATFAVAILSSLCVEITEPLVRVWRHVRDHAQQVEGEHLVEDDSLLVQTILAQPGRGQQQQLNIFLESLPERILSRAFFAIVLMTRSRCLITAGGLSGWIVTGSKGRSRASAGGDSSSETSGPAACAGRRLEALVRYTLLNAARSRGAAERYRLRPSGWGFKAAIRPFICSTTLATHHRQQQQPPVLLRLWCLYLPM